MPFKTSGRASLMGETTAGTYSQTYSLDIGNDPALQKALQIAATRN
jgi:hypothetical protein